MADVKISALPAAGAITGAELVPIVQGGITSKSTVDGIKNGAIKVYRALVTQAGTAAPTATVLENTLGGTPVWTRSSAGTYLCTLAGIFLQLKTHLLIQSNNQNLDCITFISRSDNNAFYVNTRTLANAGTDDILQETSVQVLIYP